jgi:hypothetical protein
VREALTNLWLLQNQLQPTLRPVSEGKPRLAPRLLTYDQGQVLNIWLATSITGRTRLREC